MKLERLKICLSGESTALRVLRYEKRLDVLDQFLKGQQHRLESLRPETMLKPGYSITRDASGNLLRSIKQIEVGQRLSTQLVDGYVESAVIQNEEHHDAGLDNIEKMTYEQKETRLEQILTRLDNYFKTPINTLAREAKEAGSLIISMHATLKSARQEITTVFQEMEKQKNALTDGERTDTQPNEDAAF